MNLTRVLAMHLLFGNYLCKLLIGVQKIETRKPTMKNHKISHIGLFEALREFTAEAPSEITFNRTCSYAAKLRHRIQ